MELAGYTYRLSEMLDVFEDMEREEYRTAGEGRLQSIDSPLPKQEIRVIPPLAEIVETENLIQLEKISIITPNSDFIVSDISFKVCFLFYTIADVYTASLGGERNASSHHRTERVW